MPKLTYARFNSFDEMPDEVFSEVEKMNVHDGHFGKLVKKSNQSSLKYCVVMWAGKEIVGWAPLYNYNYYAFYHNVQLHRNHRTRYSGVFVKSKHRCKGYASTIIAALKAEHPKHVRRPTFCNNKLVQLWNRV